MASQDSSHVAHGQKLAYFQPIAGTDADNNEDPSRNQALIAPAYSEATTSSYQHAFHEAVYTYLGILPDEYSQTDLALINARSVGTWSRDFAEVRNKYVLLKNSMASPWKDRKQSLGFKLGAELAALVKEGAWLIGHHLSHAGLSSQPAMNPAYLYFVAFHEAIISDHGRLGELRKDEHDLIGKIHHDFAQEHQSAILGRSQSDVRQVAAATARRLYEQRAHAAVLALRDVCQAAWSLVYLCLNLQI